MDEKPARLIAFYLPQYYPIPENDKWWGKDFTEWTNVKKAKPLFPGHYQPHIPGELGYYDLRDPKIRQRQVDLAKEHGIEGFCYWHYWFGGGRRILERVFEEVLTSGKPDFPFCLAWANISWAGVWYGARVRTLIEQRYPGIDDYNNHFYSVIDALKDKRYIKIGGRPIFLIFYPQGLPDQQEFVECWRSLADKEGLKGIYFIAIAHKVENVKPGVFDALTIHAPSVYMIRSLYPIERLVEKIIRRVSSPEHVYNLFPIPWFRSYKRIVETAFSNSEKIFEDYPCILPNWDNSPRRGAGKIIFHNSTPDLFRTFLRAAIKRVANRNNEERIIFIKSWNEWAEGNYLEPDRRFGRGYLEVIKEELISNFK